MKSFSRSGSAQSAQLRERSVERASLGERFVGTRAGSGDLDIM